MFSFLFNLLAIDCKLHYQLYTIIENLSFSWREILQISIRQRFFSLSKKFDDLLLVISYYALYEIVVY